MAARKYIVCAIVVMIKGFQAYNCVQEEYKSFRKRRYQYCGMTSLLISEVFSLALKAQLSENVLLLQNGQLCSRIKTALVFFPFPNIFLQKMRVLLLPEVEKLQP